MHGSYLFPYRIMTNSSIKYCFNVRLTREGDFSATLRSEPMLFDFDSWGKPNLSTNWRAEPANCSSMFSNAVVIKLDKLLKLTHTLSANWPLLIPVFQGQPCLTSNHLNFDPGSCELPTPLVLLPKSGHLNKTRVKVRWITARSVRSKEWLLDNRWCRLLSLRSTSCWLTSRESENCCCSAPFVFNLRTL